jgi:hypothetical protein
MLENELASEIAPAALSHELTEHHGETAHVAECCSSIRPSAGTQSAPIHTPSDPGLGGTRT